MINRLIDITKGIAPVPTALVDYPCRQIVAVLRGEAPAYSADELAQAAREFEMAYEAYGEHQRAVERYWCLRYLVQESIAEAGATVIRDELVRIDDDEICAALALLCTSAKLAVEPAGAAATAALLQRKEQVRGKRVGIIVCGANVAPDLFATCLLRGRVAR